MNKRKTAHRSAFTMVELTMVIAVTATLLVATIMGKDIVRTAQVYRLAKEIESIKTDISIFNQFFGQLPGNIDKARCMNFQILSSQTFHGSSENFCSDNVNISGTNYITGQSITSGIGGTSSPCIDCQVINANSTIAGDIYAMRSISWLTKNFVINDARSVLTNNSFASYNLVNQFFPKSKTVKNSYWSLLSTELTRGLRNELKIPNSYLNQEVYKKSQMTLFYNVESSCINANGSACSEGIGALTPYQAVKLDYKIDDGKPYSGMIIAFKPPSIQENSSISDTEMSKYCTTLAKNLSTGNLPNVMQSDLDTAEYTSILQFMNQNKYGCNISILLH